MAAGPLSARRATSLPLRLRAIAIVAACGFVALAMFQAVLASGAPLGRAAWGGASAILPPSLRFASGVAAFYLLIAAIVVLVRSRLLRLPGSRRIWHIATWVLVVQLFLNTLANLASQSAPERWMALVSLPLALLCLSIARSPLPDDELKPTSSPSNLVE